MLMSLTKTNMYFKCWLYHAQTQCIVYTEQTSHGQRCSTVILGVFLTGTMSGEFFCWEMSGKMGDVRGNVRGFVQVNFS